MPQKRHGRWFEPLDAKIRRLTFVNDEGCWEIVEGAERNNRGYGRVWAEGRHQLLHRVAYMVFIGPIPEGYDVGHKCHDAAAKAGTCTDGPTCRHRTCGNPDHLKAEPRGDNLKSSVLWRRSVGMKGEPNSMDVETAAEWQETPTSETEKHQRSTECKRGHEFTEENTYVRANGFRSCKICNKMTPQERKDWDAAN